MGVFKCNGKENLKYLKSPGTESGYWAEFAVEMKAYPLRRPFSLSPILKEFYLMINYIFLCLLKQNILSTMWFFWWDKIVVMQISHSAVLLSLMDSLETISGPSYEWAFHCCATQSLVSVGCHSTGHLLQTIPFATSNLYVWNADDETWNTDIKIRNLWGTDWDAPQSV